MSIKLSSGPTDIYAPSVSGRVRNQTIFVRFIGLAIISLALLWALARIAHLLIIHSGQIALSQAQRSFQSRAQAAVASGLFERAGAFTSADPAVLRELATAYRLQGRYDDAINALETAYRLAPASPLTRIDLACVYALDGISQPITALGAAGGAIQASDLIRIGDSFLEQRMPVEARDWYAGAARMAPELQTDRSFQFRRLLAAISSHSPDTAARIDNLRPLYSPFEIPTTQPSLTLTGDQLVWASPISADVTYGSPLSSPSGGGSGALWWPGRGTAIVRVITPGRYRVAFTVRNPSTATMQMAFGIDGLTHLESMIDPDGSNTSGATVVAMDIELSEGYHSIDTWFLINSTADGIDQDAIIEQFTVTLTDG